jgi:hypothetical protein
MRPAVQWWSNAPHCPTGYGVQTRTVVEYLARNGWDISVSANYGVQVVPVEHQVPDGPAIRVYPAGHDNYSQDVIAAHYHNYREEVGRRTVLVTLYDTWVLKNPNLSKVDHILSWTPVDHMPMPPAVLAWGRQPNVTPVAMTRFGLSEFEKRDVEAIYIPHTVEPVFKPSKGGGALMQAPDDAFVVMMNAANKGAAPPRKAWSENFMAMSVFMKNHPDVFFYVHSEAKTPFGIDLVALQDALGMDKSRVMFPDQYAYRMSFYDDKALAKMYSRADVLLAVSLGEGFGVPTVEAQACGTRVIGSDWAATPELLSDDCLMVEGQPEWDHSQLAWWFRPNVKSMVAALEEMYGQRGQSQKCISKAGEYRPEKVLPEWEIALEVAG